MLKLKKLLLLSIIIISISFVAGCEQKRYYSEEDKVKFADLMKQYDEMDTSKAYFNLDYITKDETITYMYKADFSDSNSLLVEYKIKINNIVKEKRVYNFDVSETITQIFDGEDLIKEESELLTKDEFINKYTCSELSKYNIDLMKATKYYRDYAGGLGDYYWRNYFHFKNYPFHVELFENSWDIKITQLYFGVERYHASRKGIQDYSFDRVIIKGKDAKKRKLKYTLVFELEKNN